MLGSDAWWTDGDGSWIYNLKVFYTVLIKYLNMYCTYDFLIPRLA